MRATCLNERSLQNKACVPHTVLKKREKEMALISYSYAFGYMFRRTRAAAHLWSSEDNLWEPALSFLYVDSGDQTQPGLASTFYQLSLLTCLGKEIVLLLLKPVSSLGFRFGAYRL